MVAPARNPAGTIGSVLAIVTVILSALNAGVSVSVPFFYTAAGLTPDAIGLVLSAIHGVVFLVAAATTVFGIVGAVRRNAPQLFAGIALGVGGSVVVLSLLSFLLPVLLHGLYQL
jgi:hypothetical protein